MTGHIGINTPKFVPPRWGRPPLDPTQTGLCKFGWVWSSLIFALLCYPDRSLSCETYAKDFLCEQINRQITRMTSNNKLQDRHFEVLAATVCTHVLKQRSYYVDNLLGIFLCSGWALLHKFCVMTKLNNCPIQLLHYTYKFAFQLQLSGAHKGLHETYLMSWKFIPSEMFYVFNAIELEDTCTCANTHTHTHPRAQTLDPASQIPSLQCSQLLDLIHMQLRMLNCIRSGLMFGQTLDLTLMFEALLCIGKQTSVKGQEPGRAIWPDIGRDMSSKAKHLLTSSCASWSIVLYHYISIVQNFPRQFCSAITFRDSATCFYLTIGAAEMRFCYPLPEVDRQTKWQNAWANNT